MPPNPDQTKNNVTDRIIDGINELSFDEARPGVFRELESALSGAGFELADARTAAEIFNDSRLYCRSENIRRGIDLITNAETISLANPDDQANMCNMSGGEGYKVAMTEGFGNKEVSGKSTLVLTFTGEHIGSRGRIPKEHHMWVDKPQTAEVSLIAKGSIAQEDIVMVSFRFPVALFPEQMLTEQEFDMLEEDKIEFIVRHYVANEKATH